MTVCVLRKTTTQSMLCALCVAMMACWSPAKSDSIAMWRVPENSGAICNYVMLKYLGKECEFRDLVSMQNAYINDNNIDNIDIKGMLYIANKYGCKLIPRVLTMKELDSIEKPVLIHINGNGAGAFMVIIGMGEGYLDMINGSNAAIQRMEITDFKRLWSGVALISGGQSISEKISASIIIGIITTILVNVYINANKLRVRWINESK